MSLLTRRDGIVLEIVERLRLDEPPRAAVDPEAWFIGIDPCAVGISDAGGVLAPDNWHGITVSEMLAENVVHFLVAGHVEEAVDHAVGFDYPRSSHHDFVDHVEHLVGIILVHLPRVRGEALAGGSIAFLEHPQGEGWSCDHAVNDPCPHIFEHVPGISPVHESPAFPTGLVYGLA